MHDLTVTLIQQFLAWLDSKTNHRYFTELMSPLAGKTDLVILPEMFNSGFSMDPAPVAESMSGKTLQWLTEQPAKIGAAIIANNSLDTDSFALN